MLKKSEVNLIVWCSVMEKFLINDVSQFCWKGPRYLLRPSVPKPVAAPSSPMTPAATKAFMLR